MRAGENTVTIEPYLYIFSESGVMQVGYPNRGTRAYSFRRDALFMVSSCLFVLIAFLSVFGCRQPEQVATPTFDPDEGRYFGPVDVAISCATGTATIRYTTDGTKPTASHGQIYTGPIHLTSATTIKARAFKDGMIDSEEAKAYYDVIGYMVIP